jgi:hypothetical protein
VDGGYWAWIVGCDFGGEGGGRQVVGRKRISAVLLGGFGCRNQSYCPRCDLKGELYLGLVGKEILEQVEWLVTFRLREVDKCT